MVGLLTCKQCCQIVFVIWGQIQLILGPNWGQTKKVLQQGCKTILGQKTDFVLLLFCTFYNIVGNFKNEKYFGLAPKFPLLHKISTFWSILKKSQNIPKSPNQNFWSQKFILGPNRANLGPKIPNLATLVGTSRSRN